MRKNYFAKIVKYTKKVFNIERSINKLSNGRKNPKYKTNQVVIPVLLGFLLRIRSFNELNHMIKDDDFNKVILKGMVLPKIDAIRDTLKVIDIDGLREMLTHGIRKARKNKVFDGGIIEGLVIVAIEGTQTYNSDKKSCEYCLKAYKKRKAEQRNFHSSVVLTTIGADTKLVIDFEPYRSGVDEAAKDEGKFNMKSVEKPLRFVKFLMKKPNGKRSQIIIFIEKKSGNNF